MKRYLVFTLIFVILLGCSTSVAQVASETTSKPTANTSTENDGWIEGEWKEITLSGEQVLWDGYRAKEPSYDEDISNKLPSDFGPYFQENYSIEKETYLLCPDEKTQAEVVHIHSSIPGDTVYIVAGVHGDERAGWYAGSLLKNISIKSGDLYILAPANSLGAKNTTRYVENREDLNRSFPGNTEGTATERFAYSLIEDIKDKDPQLLLDLHEAIIMTEGRDFLGSTLIFTDLTGMEDLFFDALFATQEGTLCSTEFGYTGPGPAGSLNATVTKELGIPTITVETFRGFHMERRIGDQLAIVEYCLRYLGLL